MLSTTVLVVTLLLALVCSIGAWAVFLRLGLRWVGAPGAAWPRMLAVAALVLIVGLPLRAAYAQFSFRSQGAVLIAGLGMLAVAVAIQCLIVGRAFRLRPMRSLQAWCPTLIPVVLSSLFAAIVFRHFLFEAYFAPTNSMAPTLLGNHWRSVCSDCGEPCFCTAENEHFHGPVTMICSNFHATTHEMDGGAEISRPDRFFVCRFLKPERWDVIAFRTPPSPGVLTVKRVVGLPGETIVIKDGFAWANGRKLTPPPDIAKLHYLADLDYMPPSLPSLWGSQAQPARLGDDEYFVLGDFSAQSNDSRLWEEGAPGHPAYAVPGSHVLGVVSHTYWPPQRWRIFR